MADTASSNATNDGPIKISAWGQYSTDGTMQYYLRSDRTDVSSQATRSIGVKKYGSSLKVSKPRNVSGVHSTLMPKDVQKAVYEASGTRGTKGADTDLVSIDPLDGSDLTDGGWHQVELVFATDRDA